MRKDITLKDPNSTFLGKFIILLRKRTYTGRHIAQKEQNAILEKKVQAEIRAEQAKKDANYWYHMQNDLQNLLDAANRKLIISEGTVAELRKGEEKYKKDLTNLERTIADQNYTIKHFLDGRMDSASLSAILSNYDSPFRTLCENLNNVLILQQERNFPSQIDYMRGDLKISVCAAMPDYEQRRFCHDNKRGGQSMIDNAAMIAAELKHRVVHQMASSLLSKDAFKNYPTKQKEDSKRPYPFINPQAYRETPQPINDLVEMAFKMPKK